MNIQSEVVKSDSPKLVGAIVRHGWDKVGPGMWQPSRAAKEQLAKDYKEKGEFIRRQIQAIFDALSLP